MILFCMASGSQDGGTTWKITVDDRRRRHHTRRVEEKWRTHVTGRRCRPLTRRVAKTRQAICQHRDFHVRCVLICPTHPHSNTPHHARRDVLAIDRRRPYNNKTIGWPAWFRHFKPVADVQGWDKDQRALQMVSYLDEKAMNVAQELSDQELYDYDVLVGLLSARFDPVSRVSASRSRFHGRTRRHQEDADTYADSIMELCRLGYPQSSPELRQELISEQFVRGQSDPELKKYLWVVIRTQKDKKLQTLIEVCTDFASLSHTTNVHRPAEQVFALEEDDDREEEMFAVVDRQQWNTQRAAEPPLSPELQQMFALVCRMGYEIRPIARRFDAPR